MRDCNRSIKCPVPSATPVAANQAEEKNKSQIKGASSTGHTQRDAAVREDGMYRAGIDAIMGYP